MDEEKEQDRVVGLANDIERSMRYPSVKTIYSFGVCDNCTSHDLAKFENGSYISKCNRFKINVNHKNPMVDCNNFSPKGILDMWQLYDMATIIDVKDNVGFRGGE